MDHPRQLNVKEHADEDRERLDCLTAAARETPTIPV